MAAAKSTGMPETVKTFAAFIGWGRSGNSFLGQVLNAHPNAMIANEGMVYDYVAQNPFRDTVYSYLVDLDEKFAKAGYKKVHKAGDQNLSLPGAFQGRRDDLIVVGNSKAARTSRTLYEAPDQVEKLIEVLGLEPKFFFLTRNPRDIIGSMIKRAGRAPRETVDLFINKTKEADHAKCYISGRFPLLSIAYEDFVASPAVVLAEMLDFVGLQHSDALTTAVEKATFSAPDRPGDRYLELAEFDREISDLIETTPCLARYAEYESLV